MPSRNRWIFGAALLVSSALAQPACDMCWDGSVPTFNNGACSPCPLQEDVGSGSGCDPEIKEFCNQVNGNFDTASCACFIEYLPTED